LIHRFVYVQPHGKEIIQKTFGDDRNARKNFEKYLKKHCNYLIIKKIYQINELVKDLKNQMSVEA